MIDRATSTCIHNCMKNGQVKPPRALKLPTVPSKLIRLALQRLHKAESDGVRINMRAWHDYSNRTGELSVCVAGAVMRKAVSDKRTCDPMDFPQATADLLEAVDCFADGRLSSGLIYMGINPPMLLPRNVQITSYYKNRRNFKAGLEMLAKGLEEVGL